jgi:Zn-finger protein
MNRADVARLLSLSAAFDARTIGEADVAAWLLALDGLDPTRCRDAIVKHYRESTDRIMPAHIRRLARTTNDVGVSLLGYNGEDGINCPECKLVHHEHEPCSILRHDPDALAKVRHLALTKAVPDTETS